MIPIVTLSSTLNTLTDIPVMALVSRFPTDSTLTSVPPMGFMLYRFAFIAPITPATDPLMIEQHAPENHIGTSCQGMI
ncbi:MAG: hypothetical protein MN733_33725 [Nitrososphaera sp.]|nr:hypothetical protein [Nitrososphaera sp.]